MRQSEVFLLQNGCDTNLTISIFEADSGNLVKNLLNATCSQQGVSFM